ncbi:uncharacterized protein CMU_042750 [Cryptosporidium muris RN66]|uniref:U1-type domain-containing protein n=1 Tax=Cryptosporidium muris (strain RN66) TaxID=441375 RepID=B6AAG0_CRYMR|nr:uncharacterized protein CMU_042750 [Cryptosporidium muris RN66]EEA05201.1 hypothetical protein, conserved [Cryptosporidium muris RN66]|eukprot:XP_002139550.1 hypothetical protein [Cryptosporidium muris RN66]
MSQGKEQNDRKDVLGRKIWDKEFYRSHKRPGNCAAKSTSPYSSNSRRNLAEIQSNLKIREENLDLDRDIGKVHIIADITKKQESVGFWCKVCEYSSHDSHSWVAHLNSEKHNRMLGMTMIVEKKSLESVKSKLDNLILQKKQLKQNDNNIQVDEQDEMEKLGFPPNFYST